VVALTNNLNGSQESDAEFEACRLAVKAMLLSIPFSSQNF
jgi:hypothetical protein